MYKRSRLQDFAQYALRDEYPSGLLHSWVITFIKVLIAVLLRWWRQLVNLRSMSGRTVASQLLGEGDAGSGGDEDGGHEDETDTWNLPPLPPPGFSLRLADGTFVGHSEDVGDDDMTIHYRDDDVTEQPDDRPLLPELPMCSENQENNSDINGYHSYKPPTRQHASSPGLYHANTISHGYGLHPGHNSLPRLPSGEQPALLIYVCYFMYIASIVFDYYCRNSELSYIRGIGFQSAPPQDGARVFNEPEDDSFRTQSLHL